MSENQVRGLTIITSFLVFVAVVIVTGVVVFSDGPKKGLDPVSAEAKENTMQRFEGKWTATDINGKVCEHLKYDSEKNFFYDDYGKRYYFRNFTTLVEE